MERDLKKLMSNFVVYGNYISGEVYGKGHINHTYRVNYNQAGRIVSYILQGINTHVFKDPYIMTENIVRITGHQAEFYKEFSDSSRRHLTPVRTYDGKYMYKGEDNTFWRVYLFIDNTVTYEVMENEEYATKTARAFGEFQKSIVGIKGGRLNEVIQDFHNTPKRYLALDESIKKDVANRAASVKKEIDFLMTRREKASFLIDLNKKGLIPERIVHNDTKLNNLMIDDKSNDPICVIDLDIVMPGFTAFDFGELMRTGVSPTEEDERDVSKIHVRMNIYEALLKGFLESASDFMNKTEKETLPWGGYLMTLENGVRFLTDHLNKDIYYKIHRENHNLDRCRTQLALVASMEKSWDAIMKAVGEY